MMDDDDDDDYDYDYAVRTGDTEYQEAINVEVASAAAIVTSASDGGNDGNNNRRVIIIGTGVGLLVAGMMVVMLGRRYGRRRRRRRRYTNKPSPLATTVLVGEEEDEEVQFGVLKNLAEHSAATDDRNRDDDAIKTLEETRVDTAVPDDEPDGNHERKDTGEEEDADGPSSLMCGPRFYF